uniref:Desaturase-7 n=1 Tax=Plutella xylostella TaxID=51655 RepID=A0A1L8D6B4_PLUXY
MEQVLIIALATIYTSGFGITAGVHRLWSHRAYKANTPLRVILALLFTITGQRDIYTWALDHRVHHKYSETCADPHDVRRGFWFAHVGWLVLTPHPAVEDRRRALREVSKDLDSDPVVYWQKMRGFWFAHVGWLVLTPHPAVEDRRRALREVSKDLDSDPVVYWKKILFIPLFGILNVALPIWIPVHCWGESVINAFIVSFVLRFTATLNIAYSVNSFAHLWGNKPYDKFISPVENQVVSLAALGEGWHNYHHVFPWDYRTSELGRVNISTNFINAFAKIGWAYDLKAASSAMITDRMRRCGDESHHQEEPDPEDKNK